VEGPFFKRPERSSTLKEVYMSASKEIGISEARTWTPTPEIIAKRSEALAKHFIAANDERQAMQARVAARNRKMAEALERQWANAGIDIKALEAVSLANSIEGQEEMNEYRRRKLPASPSGPDVSPYRVPRSPTGVAPAITVVQRTPPYDIAVTPGLFRQIPVLRLHSLMTT
jgi:hypothetical protein